MHDKFELKMCHTMHNQPEHSPQNIACDILFASDQYIPCTANNYGATVTFP